MHLILTGEKRDPELVRALSTFSDASTEFVALDELSGVKRRDDTHVVLILHKQPGAAPLRLFASLDGDLRHHRDTLMAWADGARLTPILPSIDDVTSPQVCTFSSAWRTPSSGRCRSLRTRSPSSCPTLTGATRVTQSRRLAVWACDSSGCYSACCPP